jgi:hypothetical protein
MKAKFTVLVSTLVIGGALALTLPSVFARNNDVATPTPIQHWHHPEIHKAIDALEEAKTAMKHADHDFGGHREKALIKADEAIFELKECLKYDER